MEDLSEEFEGDGAEKDFTLTGDVNEIISITVDGTAVSADAYTYDADTKTVSFVTAPADDAVIIVTYK